MATFQRFHQSNFIHVDKYGAFVTTPRSHFNECSHFQTLQHGPFQSFEEECFFRPFSGQSCSWALALCDRFGDRGFDSLRFSITSVRTGGFHTHQKKPLGRLQHSLVNLARSMWQQTMKRKFLRILVVVLAAFALFAFVYPDDLSENDTACGQSGMLKESSVRTPTHWDRQGAHRDQQALALDSTRPLAPNKKTCSPSSSPSATSPMLLSLAACVLPCSDSGDPPNLS